MKVITYNRSGLVLKIPYLKTNGIIYPDIPNDYILKFHSYNLLFSTHALIDRSGGMTPFMDWKPSPPIKELTSYTYTFEDVCLSRARSLIDTGKKISIFWSGGLDSTTALAVLMSEAPKDQIRVICSPDSIIESGDVFDRYVKGKAEISLHPHAPGGLVFKRHTFHPDHDILVNGHPVDQLFGPFGMPLHRVIPGVEKLAPQDVIPPEVLEFFMPALARSPVPIQDMIDFIWYYKLNFGVDSLLNYPKAWIPRPLWDILQPFYQGPTFENWAMHNYRSLYETHPLKQKKPMRDLIRKIWGAEEYCTYKTRCNSPVAVQNYPWAVLLEDGTRL